MPFSCFLMTTCFGSIPQIKLWVLINLHNKIHCVYSYYILLLLLLIYNIYIQTITVARRPPATWGPGSTLSDRTECLARFLRQNICPDTSFIVDTSLMARNYCSKHYLLLLFELFSYFLLGPPIHLLCRPAGMGAVRSCHIF